VRTEYKQLLKQNIISNSSVLVKKDLFVRFAPDNEDKHDMHEDFACWLGMLRAGHTARGIDEPLITYRLSKSSMSGNKLKAYSMNMYTYKYVGLGFFSRLYYQMCYSVNGIKKYRHLR
jgi:teichuronic acid biosynthesis glycosyltransferase TuaG